MSGGGNELPATVLVENRNVDGNAKLVAAEFQKGNTMKQIVGTFKDPFGTGEIQIVVPKKYAKLLPKLTHKIQRHIRREQKMKQNKHK